MSGAFRCNEMNTKYKADLDTSAQQNGYTRKQVVDAALSITIFVYSLLSFNIVLIVAAPSSSIQYGHKQMLSSISSMILAPELRVFLSGNIC
jgi:hypothetical protein